METRTRFDFNSALQSWREELAAHPSLTPEDRRELETHLCDSIAGLRERGLNDEESFWLARRRVGHPQQIAEEFAKADPTNAWRERVFWLVVGLFTMRLWSGAPLYLLDGSLSWITRMFANNLFLPDWVLFYLPFRPVWANEHVLHNQIFIALFRFLPLIWLVAVFARGHVDRIASALHFFFSSRPRFLVTAASSAGIYYAWVVSQALRYVTRMAGGPETPSLGFLIQHSFANAIISLMLVGLIAWLMPATRQPIERT